MTDGDGGQGSRGGDVCQPQGMWEAWDDPWDAPQWDLDCRQAVRTEAVRMQPEGEDAKELDGDERNDRDDDASEDRDRRQTHAAAASSALVLSAPAVAGAPVQRSLDSWLGLTRKPSKQAESTLVGKAQASIMAFFGGLSSRGASAGSGQASVAASTSAAAELPPAPHPLAAKRRRVDPAAAVVRGGGGGRMGATPRKCPFYK